MIGGKDVIMSRRGDSRDVEAIAMCFLERWPDMVVQRLKDEVLGEPVRYADLRDPLEGDGEFFLYRDRAAMEKIEADGVTDDVQDAIINVIVGREYTTVVMGDMVDAAPVVAYYYRFGEQETPTA